MHITSLWGHLGAFNAHSAKENNKSCEKEITTVQDWLEKYTSSMRSAFLFIYMNWSFLYTKIHDKRANQGRGLLLKDLLWMKCLIWMKAKFTWSEDYEKTEDR